jgi:hypothetical protein
MGRARWSRCPNAFNHINTWGAIFDELRPAVLQERELHQVAITIDNDMVAPAWSIDQGFFFFNEHFYILVMSSFLVDLLDALLLGRPANMTPLALGLHLSPTTPDYNGSPSAILLGRLWPQGIVSPTTIIFLDNLDRQLLHVRSIRIGLC